LKTTIKNHLEELQVSNERMLLYHSDNKMLISFFKDLKEKLVYLQELTDMEARYNLTPIADCIEELLEVDSELTHIDFSIQLKEVISEKKVVKVNAKLF
jgi:hypothetical protein